ncbi:MAG TPA: glycosyltransferase family 39 protein, partial [Chloroflexota bacterium]|nr:glycosyltransferase family 39 protein [Chloroflexota bacterium]
VAMAGAATIPLVFLVGKRLYGRWAGVAAAALMAASVMHVQMSHQARHWVPVTLLTLVVLWVSLDLAEKGRRRDYWLSGLLVGITAATSFNGFLVMGLPLMAHLMLLRKRGGRLMDWRLHIPMAVPLLLAPAVFFALNPYILLQFNQFAAFQSKGDSSIGGQIRGHFENFFTEKGGFPFFAEATLAYEPAITLLGFAGAVLAARRFQSTRALVLIYPVFHYFMFSTTAPSLEQRYMLPAVAVWALPAGLAVSMAGERLYRRLGSGIGAATAATGISLLVLFLVSLPSLRYDWLLAQTDTRTQAAEWIEHNIPAGSDLAVESYPPPLTADLETLRAQQQTEPKSLGSRDQWLLEKGLPAGETAYRLTLLNLIDTTPTVDNLTPYLATHSHRYFVVTDFRWKSDHLSHLALKGYLAKNGRLLATFAPSGDAAYAPSDMLNNMEDPLSELFRVGRPGPTIQVYEVTR